MSLVAPTIVIFDMDGTTIRHLNPKMLGLMEWLDDTSFKASHLWKKVFERKLQAKQREVQAETQNLKPSKSILVHRALHKFSRKPVKMLVEPCPGIFEVLDLLKNRGIPMAIVSNGLGKGYGLDIMQQFGLDEYFPVTIFREDIYKAKPHPESILKALSLLRSKLSSHDVVWYIGDRHKDVIATQNAQKSLPCPIIPIAYDIKAAIAILEKNYGPDHILMSYHDMYTTLTGLFSDVLIEKTV